MGFTEWLADHLFVLFLLIFIALIGFVVLIDSEDSRQRKRLMVECMKDHKEYECASMLKHSSPALIPMPMVIR